MQDLLSHFLDMSMFQRVILVVSALLVGVNKSGIPGLGMLPVILLALAFDPKFAHVLVNNSLLLNELFDRREVRKKIRRKLYSPANKRGMLVNIGYRFLNYRRFFGFENAHVSVSYLRSSFEAMWEKAYDTLDQTCRSRFRSDDDVNQYVIQQYQYVNGLFTPSNLAAV